MKTIQQLTAAILLTASCAGLSVSCVPRSETKNLKIICYNILYGMRRDTTQGKRLFAEWVRQQNPDILALQEVNDFTQFTLETLAAEYGHDYAVISKDPKLIPGSVGSRTKFPVSISSKSPVVNVDKVLDNMWHGFIKCKVEGYNVIVLHLNPHLYEARRREIRTVLETVKQSGPFEKWIIMGDFNTVSPLDSAVYADGKYLQRKKEQEKVHTRNNNLPDGQLDFAVSQAILDFGFVDAGWADRENYRKDGFTRRIDFIYVSPDLRDRIVSCRYITDDFTAAYSDHIPVELVLKHDSE